MKASATCFGRGTRSAARAGAGENERAYGVGLRQRDRHRDISAHREPDDVRGRGGRRPEPAHPPRARGSSGRAGSSSSEPVPRLSNDRFTAEQRKHVVPRPRALAEPGYQEQRRVQFQRSTSIAIPCPPPTHIVSSPIVPSPVSRSLSRVHMIRAPVIPYG